MIKQILSFGFVESLSKGLNFLVLLILPLFLPLKEFGIVGIIVSIEALFSTMLLFGQDRVILRYYSFEKDKKSFVYSVISVWAVVAFAILLLSLAITYLFFNNGIWGIKFWPDTVFLTIIVILTSFRFLFISVVRTQLNFKKFTIDKLVFQLLKISIVILFALNFKTSGSYIYGVLIAITIVFLLEMYFLKDSITASLESTKIKRNWNFGIPFVFHVMSGNILLYFNRFALENYTTMENVGLYTFASNLGLGITFVFAAFIVFFEPQIYKYSSDINKSERWLGLFSLSTLAINSIIIAIIVLLAPIIIESFFDKEYMKIIKIIPIILAAISLKPIYLQSSFRLTIYERTKLIPLATIIAGFFNISLNIILIPKFGLFGAALTTFISYFVLSLVTFIFSLKYSPVSLTNIIGKEIFIGAIFISFLSFFSEYSVVFILALFIFATNILYFLLRNYHKQLSQL